MEKKQKQVYKMWKGILAGTLTTAMTFTMLSGIEVQNLNVVKNIPEAKVASVLETDAVSTGTAVKIVDKAIASYSFDSTEEVKNLNNPKYNLSEIREVTGCGNVLIMGERQRNSSYGVEIENPYAGKADIYAESLADALENNGVVYNGTIADETAVIGNSVTGTTFAALDTLAMPMEGRTYPYPKWEKGFTISTWVRVPENATEDTTLFMFKRRMSGKGRGGLTVRFNGTVMFFEGDTEEDACRNCYHFEHNMDKIDPLAKAGQWVFVTITIENDHIGVFFDGVEATGKPDSKHVNGTTLTKMFNHGFGYRDSEFKINNPSEAYKNYRDLLSNFTAEERAIGDFSDFSKYNFLNSAGQSIIEMLTDEEAQFYIGGDNGDAIWGLGEYTDHALGLMVDDLSFFDVVLSKEEIATLYSQAEIKSNDFTEIVIPAPSEKPPVSDEAIETDKPPVTQVPVESEKPEESQKPVDSNNPPESDNPQESVNPQSSSVPATAQPQNKLGDVDGNGTIELNDAQLTLKAALKIIVLDSDKISIADVDGNKEVNLQDAQKILKAALKIEKL